MKKFLTVAALIWVFFLLQTSVCPWIAFGSIKPNLLVILVASIGFMEGSKAGMWTGFALWAFGRSVCGKRRQPHFPERCYRRLARFLRAAVFVCRIFMRTGEPAFLSRRYQASADDDYRCRPLRQFRLLSDYVSDAGAP